MIEIITQQVEMPKSSRRRFQCVPIHLGKWKVVDSQNMSIRYIGKFEEASLVCHALNKKFYLNEKRSSI